MILEALSTIAAHLEPLRPHTAVHTMPTAPKDQLTGLTWVLRAEMVRVALGTQMRTESWRINLMHFGASEDALPGAWRDELELLADVLSLLSEDPTLGGSVTNSVIESANAPARMEWGGDKVVGMTLALAVTLVTSNRVPPA